MSTYVTNMSKFGSVFQVKTQWTYLIDSECFYATFVSLWGGFGTFIANHMFLWLGYKDMTYHGEFWRYLQNV